MDRKRGLCDTRAQEVLVATEYPEQRRIPARIHTLAGWLSGTFHVPVAKSFVEHLHAAGDFLTLTDVLLPGHKSRLEFFALQRAATLLILPETTEDDLKLAEVASNAATHTVACLLERGVLNGTLALPPSLRVSDFLLSQKGFFVVRSCTLGTQGSADDFSVAMMPLVIVHAAGVIGIAEMPGG
jgi:hypothetical protein